MFHFYTDGIKDTNISTMQKKALFNFYFSFLFVDIEGIYLFQKLDGYFIEMI